MHTLREHSALVSSITVIELDGMPFPCTLLRELMYGNESHYLVGIRYQGDEHGAYGFHTLWEEHRQKTEASMCIEGAGCSATNTEHFSTLEQTVILDRVFNNNHGPSPDSEGDLAVLTMSDHCRQMVGKLREFIDQSVNSVGPINDMAGVDKLLKKIDSAFFDFFVGPLNFVSTQASGPPGVYSGSSGFKDDYKDSLPGQRYSDQTHHFAAYFHAGIWAGISWKAYAHSLTDRWTNEGDRQLGEAAFSLGVSLRARQTGSFTRTNRNNPRAVFPETVPIYESYEDRLKRILGIADAIEKAICD